MQAAQQLAWSQQTNWHRRCVVELVHNWWMTDVGFANNPSPSNWFKQPVHISDSNPDSLKQRSWTGHRLKLTQHENSQPGLARMVLTYAKQIHTQSELWVWLSEAKVGPITASTPVAAGEVADDDGGEWGESGGRVELPVRGCEWSLCVCGAQMWWITLGEFCLFVSVFSVCLLGCMGEHTSFGSWKKKEVFGRQLVRGNWWTIDAVEMKLSRARLPRGKFGR